MTTSDIRPISWQKILLEEGVNYACIRSNLCALSQIHNLYFFATEAIVQVYTPGFPDQSLVPVTHLAPPKVGRFYGYIDTAKPHCINHLITAFLGKREILLLCCDDGDVCAWYTDHIKYHIDAGFHPPPPWMTDCVRISAWGLAVHTEARKIAVTCNSSQVIIFEFGLTEIEETCNDAVEHTVRLKGFNKTTVKPKSSFTPARNTAERYSSRKLWLPAATTNLPCVSFCNTGEDPRGEKLVCGDINGRTMLWTLDDVEPIEWWTAHYCDMPRARDCQCYKMNNRFRHAIWGLYWLDPRSFQFKGPVVDSDPESSRHSDVMVGDASKALTSPWRVHRSPTPTEGMNTTTVPMSSNDSDESEDSDSGDAPDTNFLDSDVDSGMANEDESEVESDNENNGDLPIWVFDAATSGFNRLDSPFRTSLPESYFIVSREAPFIPRRFPSEVNLPSVPFLQISSELVFLDPEYCDEKSTSVSTVGMAYPMRQYIPQRHYFRGYFNLQFMINRRGQDRMIYSAIIAELGIVFVAAPVGRCAVISLHHETTVKRQRKYGMNLECILPTEKQELEKQRPAALLIGLAVAPLQGFEKKKERVDGIWRLIMHYNDGTVLSYLVSRDAAGNLQHLDVI